MISPLAIVLVLLAIAIYFFGRKSKKKHLFILLSIALIVGAIVCEVMCMQENKGMETKSGHKKAAALMEHQPSVEHKDNKAWISLK